MKDLAIKFNEGGKFLLVTGSTPAQVSALEQSIARGENWDPVRGAPRVDLARWISIAKIAKGLR